MERSPEGSGGKSEGAEPDDNLDWLFDKGDNVRRQFIGDGLIGDDGNFVAGAFDDLIKPAAEDDQESRPPDNPDLHIPNPDA